MAESYTTPHSLPFLGTGDYVRSPTGDNLRKQLNALAVASNNALTAEGARAESAAKSYADTKDTDNRSAWAAADTATLNSAKSYTDGQVSTDRGRLTSIEAKQAVKAVKLEAGKWVWDISSAATHYVIPDHTGALVVRATPWPVPAATPSLNW